MSPLLRLTLAGFALSLAACSQDISEAPAPTKKISKSIDPQIVVGDINPADKTALAAWIDDAVALFKSPAFEANAARAALLYPEVYLSKSEDVIPTQTLLKRLKTDDPSMPGLWWPKTYVVLDGEPATRSQDRFGFGFTGSRKAAAGPHPQEPAPQKTGQIEIGRLHLARYTQGDSVEKSCALNTLVHEISHTLSETPDIYWMHILDSERDAVPPRGIFEASYFIGVIAQCTYLDNIERISPSEFNSCILTFSDPSLSSRFRSSACDDFPGDKPITPRGIIRQPN